MTEEQKKEYLEYLKKEHNLNDAQAEEYYQYVSSEEAPVFTQRKLNLPFNERFAVKNIASSPEAGAQYLKKLHPDMDFKVHEGEIYGKNIGGEEYEALDPNLSAGVIRSLLDLPADIADVGTDILKGSAASAGAVAGSAVNPVVGGYLGAGAGAGLVEGLKQKIGEMYGIENNINPTAIGVDMATAGIPLEKLIKPLSDPIKKLTSKLGEKIYKSSPMLSAIDKEFIKQNPRYRDSKTFGPSDVLNKYGIKGTNEQIAEQTDDLLEKLLAKRQSLLDLASDKGAEVDSKKIQDELKGFLKSAMEDRNPYRAEAAKQVESKLLDYSKLTPSPEKVEPILDVLGVKLGEKITPAVKAPSPKEMSQINSDFYKYFDSAYRQNNLGDLESSMIKNLGKTTKEEIESSVGRTLGEADRQSLSSLNDEMSKLLAVQKTIGNKGAQQGKRIFTEMDAMSLGYNPAVFALKQGGKFWNSDLGRTSIGRALQENKGLRPESKMWNLLLLDMAKDQLGGKNEK